MATEQPESNADRIRSTALRHARDIEERKKLQASIADLVVEAFDLPSKPDADPAKPQPSDASLFKHCLSLFQTSDLDDLIYERNVDNRCGYALCPRPNLKLAHGGQKVWNQKGGKDFKLVDKSELEKWCSKACQERTAFVRAQLGTEPAWLRTSQAVDVKLLDEVGSESLADPFKGLSLAEAPDTDIAEKMQALALERGELNVKADDSTVDLVERTSDAIPKAPTLKGSRPQNAVEGHKPRQVRFLEK
ncbi:uncharacterized protein Z520_03240 [Fonsecaea multimorphosa CBS 102226]|uniref:RNA polymerase II subunit B1 CTD phosphatase RPAP2 homolog n=1 Tax=Fonsecaea multimorphosa CBS 102226 TaxID=1442371 RepID=A0A0D2IU79_9EURO|nr:uncharacterized protein Z520_03240 [Fonsecaea multimorphosa CBS 102226]KIY00577.1 hypothetical protein Z520_03240 [Fonsecaea multimorphosa CBS 102226]OAL18971.1 hypothetical protein AYO22_10300 [Fonsecaea multimorphosa]